MKTIQNKHNLKIHQNRSAGYMKIAQKIKRLKIDQNPILGASKTQDPPRGTPGAPGDTPGHLIIIIIIFIVTPIIMIIMIVVSIIVIIIIIMKDKRCINEVDYYYDLLLSLYPCQTSRSSITERKPPAWENLSL